MEKDMFYGEECFNEIDYLNINLALELLKEDIKNKIINEYVSSLQQTQSPISITNSGYVGGIAHTPKFGSLEEASKYVENMFKF